MLALAADGDAAWESGWQDVLSFAGSGGGVNAAGARPDWQRANGLPSGTERLVPDVAAPASTNSGFMIVHDGKQIAVGGTSAGAPFWAAVQSLVEQYATANGAPEPGFFAPVLYSLASMSPSPLRDVTRGGNRHYDAAVGWDHVTGLGSPDVWALAQSVVALAGGSN